MLAQHALHDLLRFLEENIDSYLVSHIVHGIVNLFFNGEFAIYIFWFLSAYVISIKLFASEERSYLARAFTKRYFRLAIPVVASVIFAYLLLSLGLMFNQKIYHPDAGAWIARYYTFEPNIFLAIKSGLWNTFFDLGGSVTYNPVLWTMNPELYGSLFIFLIFGVLGHNKFRFVIYIIVAIGTFALSKYWMLTFILGFALCDLNYHDHKTVVHSLYDRLLINQKFNVLIFVGLTILGGFPNYYGFFYVGISGLIVFVILKTWILRAFFQNKIFVWLGRISFGLYLIHFPLICSFSSWLYLILPFEHTSRIPIVFFLSTIVSLFLSHWFTNYVDRFAIRFSNRIGDLVAG